MAQKHRKCDSSKYRKSQKKLHEHILARKLKNEMKQREHDEDLRRWREEREHIADEERRLNQRLLNVLSFRLWRLDPAYYDHWAQNRQLRQVMTIWGVPERLTRLFE